MVSQRFLALKNKLKELNFVQPFSEDSLELVEKLLKSFVKLSEVHSYPIM
jgi:hypothetical protein